MRRLNKSGRVLNVRSICHFVGFHALFVAMFVMSASPAVAATTRYVDDTGSDIANNCTNNLMPCMTIQHAVDVASAGDTILVADGMYPGPAAGPLTINKDLTLEGAQAGNDARTRSGAESVITDPQGTIVTASGVIIDGFTVQDSVLSAFTGYGIDLSPGIGGTQIVNNIIQNNIVGIGLANLGA